MNRFSIFGVLLLLFSIQGFAKDISAYFSGKLRDEASVIKTLENSGFEVVATYKIDRKGKLETVIFTSDKLKKFASKKNRGFFAIGRVLINQKDGEIRVTNPDYFGRAFLQDDFSKDVHSITKKLKSAFGDLKGTDDTLDEDDLEDYHFMFGMPYYGDMIEIEGTTPKNPIFSLKVGNATLYGVELGRRTKKFTKKIGRENSLVLPYTVLVEGGKAKILNPRYYIAVSYPKLSMGQFTKIATIPGAIETDINREFK